MGAIASLLIVLAISLLVTRVAAMALMLTGMSREAAKFQARSSFTGVGYTTNEAEVDVQAIQRLASDIPALWGPSSSYSLDQKQIVRHLIEQVVVEIQGGSEIVDVTIVWRGGFHCRYEVVRSVARFDQLSNFQELKSRATELWRSGRSTTAIAEVLNREGFRCAAVGTQYTRYAVRRLLDSWSLTETLRAQIPADLAALGADEWWLLDLSSKLRIARATLAKWCRRGWVHARQLPGQRRWWIIWADKEECARLRELYECGRGWPRHNGSPYPEELKKPKPKRSSA